MKSILLALALIGGGVLTAATVSDNITLNDLLILAKTDIETRKAEIERLKPIALASASHATKISYACAVASLYVREHLDTATFTEVSNLFDETLASLKPSENLVDIEKDATNVRKINATEGSFVGVPTSRALRGQVVEAFKDSEYPNTNHHVGLAVWFVTKGDVEQTAPHFVKSQSWYMLVNIYGRNNQFDKAAEYFWLGAGDGSLTPNVAVQWYEKIIAHELAKEDADLAVLKTKVQKAIIVYKAKSRTWQATPAVPVNYALQFVGMLTDTLKDL